MLAYLLALADAPAAVALFAPALFASLAVALVMARAGVEGAIDASIAAFLLLTNWFVNALHAYMTGNAVDPIAMASIDWITGILLFPLMPRSAWATGIVLLYGVQLVAHLSRFLLDWLDMAADAVADGPYYWTLSYTAWAQVAFLGAWIIGGGYCRYRDAFRRASPPQEGVRGASHKEGGSR